MSADLHALLHRYLRGDAPLEATARACAHAYAAEGWALHLAPADSDPVVVRRADALRARFRALTGQDGETAG